MSSNITLTNGVVVTDQQRADAFALVVALCDYAQDVLKEKTGQDHGIVWDTVGYVHGHHKTIPKKWHYTLRTLGIMDDDNTIPLERQWAVVSLCCRGEKLGKYARDKLRS